MCKDIGEVRAYFEEEGVDLCEMDDRQLREAEEVHELPDGRFLVQKRSNNKESHPGEWDITGGAVLRGEESLEGAKRETLEEVGIDISDANIHFVGRVKKRKSFADVYFVEKEFAISDCVLQKDEVDEVRFVDSAELLYLQMHDRLREPEYIEVIQKAVEHFRQYHKQ